MQRAASRPGRLRQAAWFIGLWAASVVGLGLVALFFRALMAAAGLTGG